MAIAFTRTGQVDDAVRCYRRALELDPALGGAHYGLAFLLLKRGDEGGAAEHLEAFLGRSPHGPESERWVRHARHTLAVLRGERADDPSAGATPTDGGTRGSDAPRGDAGHGPASAGGAGARF
jgi:tetratricopeptide (TPR) repeat protein